MHHINLHTHKLTNMFVYTLERMPDFLRRKVWANNGTGISLITAGEFFICLAKYSSGNWLVITQSGKIGWIISLTV